MHKNSVFHTLLLLHLLVSYLRNTAHVWYKAYL